MSALPISQQITFLYTRNLDASSEFYGEALGLDLELDQGACRLYRICYGAYVGLCERPDAPQAPHDPGTRHVILTLVTPSVDEWHDRLAELGVPIEKAPTVNPTYNIYHAFVRDPNGYLVEIQRFLDPAWSGGSGA